MMFPGRRGSIGKIRNIQGFSDHWSYPAVGMSSNFVAGQKARVK